MRNYWKVQKNEKGRRWRRHFIEIWTASTFCLFRHYLYLLSPTLALSITSRECLYLYISLKNVSKQYVPRKIFYVLLLNRRAWADAPVISAIMKGYQSSQGLEERLMCWIPRVREMSRKSLASPFRLQMKMATCMETCIVQIHCHYTQCKASEILKWCLFLHHNHYSCFFDDAYPEKRRVKIRIEQSYLHLHYTKAWIQCTHGFQLNRIFQARAKTSRESVSGCTVTTASWPLRISPLIIRSASAAVMLFWMRRLRGRAP